MKKYIFIAIGLFFISLSQLQGQTALEIIKKSDEKLKGKSSFAKLSMKINRADWNREIKMKAWSKGDEESLILITSPIREKGISFLKKGNEMWNWQPTIERIVKMPPSMMMQSWMGSDFTNDDLAKQSSIVTDYSHKLLGEEEIDGRLCHIIELIPKEDAPVVWGKIKIWVSKEELLQLKVKFFDEDGYLVNTLYGKKVKNLGGKILPSVLKVVPEENPENSTVVTYEDLQFGVKFDKNFFTTGNMKRIR